MILSSSFGHPGFRFLILQLSLKWNFFKKQYYHNDCMKYHRDPGTAFSPRIDILRCQHRFHHDAAETGNRMLGIVYPEYLVQPFGT